jgi:hypothetical protein
LQKISPFVTSILTKTLGENEKSFSLFTIAKKTLFFKSRRIKHSIPKQKKDSVSKKNTSTKKNTKLLQIRKKKKSPTKKTFLLNSTTKHSLEKKKEIRFLQLDHELIKIQRIGNLQPHTTQNISHTKKKD